MATNEKMLPPVVTDFLAGGIAAGISKTLVAPIERIKMLIQTQDSIPAIRDGLMPRYAGIVDCSRRVVRDQGVASLWRGNGANVLRYFPTQALNFSLKDTIKRNVPKYDKDREFGKFFATNIASGGLAGALALLVVYPLDFVRTRLAADVGKGTGREFTGMADCMRKTYRATGYMSLYQGFGVSVQGIFVYRGVYFGLFDTVKAKLFKEDGSTGLLAKWAAAQGATATAGIVCYPWDTVRRRMMLMAGKQGAAVQYRSTTDCWRKIFAQEGVRGFFKGAGVNVARGAGGALVLVFYDEFKKFLSI